MKKLFILFAILLFTLSLSSFALAEHVFVSIPTSSVESFYLTSSDVDLSICSCSIGMDSVRVINDGGVPTIVELSSNLDYVSFSKDSVSLLSGDSELVYVYINAPCDVSNDKLEIYASSNDGDSQIIKRKIDFKNCDNLGIIPPASKINSSICTPFMDSFTIVNTGTFLEKYEVSINKYSDYTSVDNKIVSIPANSRFKYNVFYNLPCDVSGDIVLDYTVSSLNNKRDIDFSNDAYISPDYNFEISGPADISICDQDEKSINITLQNNNNFNDEYLVKFDGPSFVDLVLPEAFLGLESNILILNSSSLNEIPLVISPSGVKDAGVYNLTFEVSSLTGDVVESLVIPLTVDHCYDFSNLVNGPSDDVSICAGAKTSIDLVLEHNGNSLAVVDLVLTAPDYVDLSSNFVIFDGKEGIKVPLLINGTPDVSETSPVIVRGYFNGEFVGSDSFNLVLHNSTACYGASVSKSNLDVRFDADYVNVKVKNIGLVNGVYTPEVFNAPDYLDLISESFVMNSSDDATVAFLINRDKLYDSAAILNNDSIVGLSSSFILNLRHSSGKDFFSEVNINFVDKPWYEWAYINTSAWWVSLSVCFQIFVILSILSIIFFICLIVKIILSKRFFSAKTLGSILLILVIIAIAVVFIWKGVPTKSMFYTSHDVDTNSTIFLKIAEDSSNSYDLTEFFFDPDDNIVDYQLSFDNASILSGKVSKDILRLSSLNDFNGLTSFEITAVDSAGESASSGDIYVDVLPVEDYTFYEFFSLACVYFNLVMFIILAFLIYLVFSFKKGFKKSNDEKQLTLVDTVVIRKQNASKQDVVVLVDKAKKQSKKKATKKVAKKSTKKSIKKSATKSATKESTSKTVVSKKVAKKSPAKKSIKASSKKVSNKTPAKSVSSKTANSASKKSSSKSDDKLLSDDELPVATIPSNVDVADFKVDNY